MDDRTENYNLTAAAYELLFAKRDVVTYHVLGAPISNIAGITLTELVDRNFRGENNQSVTIRGSDGQDNYTQVYSKPTGLGDAPRTFNIDLAGGQNSFTLRAYAGEFSGTVQLGEDKPREKWLPTVPVPTGDLADIDIGRNARGRVVVNGDVFDGVTVHGAESYKVSGKTATGITLTNGNATVEINGISNIRFDVRDVNGPGAPVSMDRLRAATTGTRIIDLMR